MRGGVGPPPPAEAPSKAGRVLNSDPAFQTSRKLPSSSPPGLLSAVGDPRTFTVLPRPASLGSPGGPCNDARRPLGIVGSNALVEGSSSAIAAGTCLDRCVGRRCPLLSMPVLGRTTALATF